MSTNRTDIRLALPSKGRLAEEALAFLSQAGLRVDKPNPRQLQATIPALPGLSVLFQRAGDIAVSVRDGSVDLGLTGWDAVAERGGADGAVLRLIPSLGFGHCRLLAIVPEAWTEVRCMRDLAAVAASQGAPLRVATKFPELTRAFFAQHGLGEPRLIQPEGTLEVAPTIGYADLICDLVSSGTTMRDNRLKALEDGLIVDSEACLIAHRQSLKRRPEVLALARQLIEFIDAHLRAAANVAIFANMRGASPEAIAARMATQKVIGGLQGPTVSPIVHPARSDWFAVHIVVRKDRLGQAISELRAIGGSGVVVAPVTYIFEEEPEACRAMVEALGRDETASREG
ncbi:MAG: ATP phosphoribosyltransferase [Deltaproteobacteria bacterium]|nr:ATP phosphoribosyltransferase [Deltaproteobacteria bacterium]